MGGEGGTVDECDMPGVVCECDEDLDCGEFEFCDMSGTGRLCECLTGYEGDPCAWGTLPKDPGFQDVPMAWTTDKGAMIDAAAVGGVDPGQTSFPGDALCSYGSVSQVVSMPPLEGSQPFVAEVSYQTSDPFLFSESSLAIGLGGAWRSDLDSPYSFETRSYCLGEAAYGGDVEIELSNGSRPYSCPTTDDLNIDRFEIVPAGPGQCPELGEFNNGDFEGTNGWEFTVAGSSTAGIEDGSGAEGSRAGIVRHATRCNNGWMSGSFSVPSASTMPSPALEFWWNATDGYLPRLSFDGNRDMFAELEGTGVPQTARYCLPPWTQGGVHTVRFELPGVSGACADALPRELVVDNTRIVNDPSCGTSEGVLDPGFESAPLPLFGAGFTSRGSVAAVVDPAAARSGQGVLEISVSFRCAQPSYVFNVIPPAPDVTGGPALRFWHRVPANPVSSAFARVGQSTLALPENGEWTEAVLCLDPGLVGRPAEVRLGLYGGDGLCASFGSTEYGYFDDLELTTDPACPTE